MATKFWVSSGYPENWEAAIKDKVWGVRTHLKNYWKNLSKGDILAFYVTSPISGIIGFGKITKIFEQDTPLWPEEKAKGEVIWPFRYNFDIIYCLPKAKWKTDKIFIKDIKLPIQAGLSAVTNKEAIATLLQRADTSWETKLSKLLADIKVKTILKKKETEPSLHNKIRDMLFEIGGMENKYPVKEFSVDGRLDVIWKRIPQGNPVYAFEVQVGGDVYHALAKLKHAYDLGATNLYLIIDKKEIPKVKALLGGAFHEIKTKLKILTLDEIQKLYELEKRAQQIKEKFGFEE